MAGKDFDKIREIREKQNERRRIEQAAEKRKKIFVQGGVILAILVVVALVVVLINTMSANKEPQAVPENSASVTVGDAVGVPLQVGGDSVTVGRPEAPVAIDIYEDYSCGHCAQYEAEVGSTLTEYIASGDVVVSYHPIRFVTNYGMNAGSAATCVATEDPGNWMMAHEALFAAHSQESDGWKPKSFVKFLTEGGITDQATLDCVASGKYTDWITANTEKAKADGVEATPSLRINGTVVPVGPKADLIDAIEAAKLG